MYQRPFAGRVPPDPLEELTALIGDSRTEKGHKWKEEKKAIKGKGKEGKVKGRREGNRTKFHTGTSFPRFQS